MKEKMKKALSLISQHKSNVIQYGGLLFVILLFSILTKGNIFSSYNLKALVGQVTPLMLMSIGMMFIFAHGGFDISCGSVAGLCALLMVMILNDTGSLLLAILASVGVSVILYIINSFVSIKLGLISTISSLAIMFGARGLITYLCSLHDGVISLNDYALISEFKNNYILQIVVCVVVILIAIILFNYTKLGYQTKAIGDNLLSAKQNGTNVNRTKMICYIIAGVLIGVSSIFLLARSGQIGKSIGSGAEMDVMVAIILGGMALSGGFKSKMSAAIIGPITYRLISNGMTMVGVESGYISLVKGIIFVVIIYLTLRQSKNIKALPR